MTATQTLQAPNNLRFYGRDARGNRVLTEGEIARLYDRRKAWSVRGDALLAAAIENAPFKPSTNLAYVHGFVRPVVTDSRMYARGAAASGGVRSMQESLVSAAASVNPPEHYAPDLRRAAHWSRQGADCWQLTTRENVAYDDPNEARHLACADFHADGQAHLFVGRAGERLRPDGPLSDGGFAIYELAIAGNVAAFFAAAGALYEVADYYGQVDAGFAVTGIRGGTTSRGGARFLYHGGYGADDYRRTERVAAPELAGGESIALRMVQPLVATTTMLDDYDPFDRG